MVRIRYSIVLFILLLATPLTTQAETLNVASSQFTLDFAELKALWSRAITLLEDGEFDEAYLKLTEVNQEKMEQGLLNLHAHAGILVEKAIALKNQGQLQQASRLLEIAQKLAPDSSTVYFSLARLQFSQNIFDIYKIGRSLFYGLLLKYTNINTLVVYINNGTLLLCLAIVLAGGVFLVVSFVYYRRAVFYSLKESFPLAIPTILGHILGWILIIGMTLGLGIFWGALCVVFLLLWQVDVPAKRVLQWLLVFGILLAGFLTVIGITYTVPEGNYFNALSDIARGNFSSSTVAALQQRLQTEPHDIYAIFGLAYIASRAGKAEDAIAAYEYIQTTYPGRTALFNNLGNLYQRMYQQTKNNAWYERAEEAYRMAIRSEPEQFEPRYNIAQLLLQQFTDGGETNTQLKIASDLDERRYNLYTELKITAVDMPFSTGVLLRKLTSKEFMLAGYSLAKDIWTSGSRFRQPWYFSIGCGVVLILSWVVGASKKKPKRGVHYCQMCGDPYTVKGKKSKEQDNFCTQCTYLFKKKSHVKPEKREKKIKQIHLRQRFRALFSKIASLCFPGAGQIYFGYIAKGMLLALSFSLITMYLLLTYYMKLLLQFEDALSPSLWTLIVMLVLLAGIYLFNLYDIFKLAPKNQ